MKSWSKTKKKNIDKGNKNTYNTGDSLVVTDPTTSPALRGLCSGERTGPSVFHELWSYVLNRVTSPGHIGMVLTITAEHTSRWGQ